MRIGAARAVAARWVSEHAAREEHFQGAYFSGSTVGQPDDDELPAASDVDIVVVTGQPEPLSKAGKVGKFLYHGTLLEVSHLPARQFSSVEDVLTTFYLANSFQVDTIISDPTGQLRALLAQVAPRFAEPVWIRRRCANARQRILSGLHGIKPAAPLHQQVTAWLFGTSVTALVPLVAALRSPTVRLRYSTARQVLAEYGRPEVYQDLLGLLGCADLTQDQVEHHVDELARVFDATAAIGRTPFTYSTDIAAPARPIAIDAARTLCRAGDHREAVFWIVATFARCHAILAAYGRPELKRELEPAFQAVLEDLGVGSPTDLLHRADEVLGYLPHLDRTVETIIATTIR